MTVTLVVPQHIAEKLSDAAAKPVETGGVLLARWVETPSGSTRLLAHQIHWVPGDAYEKRSPTELIVTSEGFVPALASAAQHQSVAIWTHTHPGHGARALPSARDRQVDESLAETFRVRTGSPWYGALVLTANGGGGLGFSGHVASEQARLEIDRLWVTGSRFALSIGSALGMASVDPMYDRNVRAFGGAIQSTLSQLQVAVVGCGGTGSAVVEQLVRLGVRNFLLFDPDTLSESNLTRVYGSFPADVGSYKVSVAANHIANIAPDASVCAEPSSITQQEVARKLLDADVIFGCTDDNAGRMVLSRLASFFLTPVIDCGVLLSGTQVGNLEGINGRITLLAPGAACLICRNRIDFERAAAEVLPDAERRQRQAEGYAPALQGAEPAVVTYTTQVASTAVGELLERMIRYGPEPPPTELLLRMHEREISPNTESPGPGHYCDPASGKLGRGMTEPFLEQLWQH